MKLALATVLVLLATPSFACSVPVFRYALEHWAADAYQVEIAHRGALTEADAALVKRLSEAKQTNIAVKLMDSSDALPRVIVKHPSSLSQPREVWSAPLTAATVEAILDSPMRREISEKLGSGDSAVWVLIESGDKAKDEAVVQLLEQELTRLAETMALPKLDDQDIKKGLVSVPDDGLRLSFPLLRLARDNSAEQFLIQTLLATEPDLRDVHEPMVFPIFGRGRVLYGLLGKGIRADNLGHAADFLIGSCSCQIKEQNPGVDLVMTADWQKLLKVDAPPTEELPKLSDIEGLKPIIVPIPQRRMATQPGATKSAVPVWVVGIGVGLVVLLLRMWRSAK